VLGGGLATAFPYLRGELILPMPLLPSRVAAWLWLSHVQFEIAQGCSGSERDVLRRYR